MIGTTGVEGGFVPFDVTMKFDWTSPPLSMNDSVDRFTKRKRIKDIRLAGKMAATGKRIPDLGKCRATLTWFVTDRIRRDGINTCATFKPLCDGLVDAGVVRDDTAEFMDTPMPTIVWLDKKAGHVAHMTLRVERIE
ncbi:hypothetical protein [Cryobacterium sp. Y62]|uniref:hypothetical protein n=1 Tax=Cryobacterium sp. Y62 TaxID=2048284 RepID=UPI000CE2F686|nr:hypothetical protein [Cryobacterium sp. Y62]